MNEEERKNKQIQYNDNDEEDDDDESEDEDYQPSDNEEKDDESIDGNDLIDNEPIDQDGEEQLKTTQINNSKLNEDEQKRRADELWDDLISSTSDSKKDKNISSSKNHTTLSSITNSNKNTKSSSNHSSSSLTDLISSSSSSKPDKMKVTKLYDFAGEIVKVEEEVNCEEFNNKGDSTTKTTIKSSSSSKIANQSPAVTAKRGLQINDLVANLGKKQKLSTLGKTKIDWDLYKKDEGIEDDLKNHIKNKNSFIEKQAFLQRADLKQFEIEKSVREKNRSLMNK